MFTFTAQSRINICVRYSSTCEWKQVIEPFLGITAARDIKKISLIFGVQGLLFMKLVGRITPPLFLTLTH